MGLIYVDTAPTRTNCLGEFYTYLHFASAVRREGGGAGGRVRIVEGKAGSMMRGFQEGGIDDVRNQGYQRREQTQSVYYRWREKEL